MRPKKVVVLIDPNETSQGIRRFRLQVWGYAVISCESIPEGKAAIEAAPDYGAGAIAVVMIDTNAWGIDDEERIEQTDRMKVLWMSNQVPMSNEYTRHTLKVQSQRKRGPRKDVRWTLRPFARRTTSTCCMTCLGSTDI